tara:strand:+ start:111 stop:260 length:150 start_codon:yes stop_codon:yes gene_type:complete
MRAEMQCRQCNKNFSLVFGYRICKNLGCTEYNKKFGKKLFKKVKKEEEE